ncbi:MAG TPA: hypothetical protein VLT15_13165 [Acidimicrobiia bacterium]|nr:hypothetical protein [Acidimicrobiia bacterium]
MRRRTAALLGGVLVLIISACAGDSTPLTTAPPSEAVRLVASSPSTTSVPALPDPGPVRSDYEVFDPDDFDNPTVIDNVYLPWVPWTRLVYKGFTNEGELIEHRVVYTVTDMTKVIDGIETLVIWARDYSAGELAETELAFFAQDNNGNVWRMGEHPEEYDDGALVDAPTWLSGLAGARAGIAMQGDPQEGSISYSQGWGPAVEFIDRAAVGGFSNEMCVAAGCYEDVLIIDEFNVEEPGAFQHKYFAPGIGNIAVGWSGSDEGREELELVSITKLSGADVIATRAAVLELEAHAYEISPDVYGLTQPISQ